MDKLVEPRGTACTTVLLNPILRLHLDQSLIGLMHFFTRTVNAKKNATVQKDYTHAHKMYRYAVKPTPTTQMIPCSFDK